MGTILAAAVGMMNAALWRLAQVNGHLQCPDREVFFQPVADGPANDPSGIKIDNHCQEQPTLTRPDIGDVASPFLIWPGRPKNLIQQIWRNIQVIPTSEIIDPYVPNLSSRLMRWYPADR